MFETRRIDWDWYIWPIHLPYKSTIHVGKYLDGFQVFLVFVFCAELHPQKTYQKADILHIYIEDPEISIPMEHVGGVKS